MASNGEICNWKWFSDNWNGPQQAEVAKSSSSGIEIYNGEVALLQIGVMITSLEVALSQKYLHIFLYKSIMWSSNK